jgi:DNA-binding NtrC family response regulator
MSERILVVDDEQSMRDTLQIMLVKEGFDVDMAGNGKEALEKIERGGYDLIVTDIKMPQMDGIGMMESFRNRGNVPVIIMTAYATKDQAIRALNLGAAFFIEKPFRKQEFLNFVHRALSGREEKRDAPLPKAADQHSSTLEQMIGASRAISAVRELIRTVAGTESTVLLTGESGTGKEIAARAIHELSLRKSGPFVAINCGAIPGELLESELFGHMKGSFTGAIRDKVGLMELANGGTFFLDEVGNTSPPTQMKILRAIQEREVMPVGGHATHKVDFRLIAATNENLEEGVTQGRFRKDLYYRLNVINIHLPPLRERPEDIDPLFRHFMALKDRAAKYALLEQDARFMDVLHNYAWPGNIRELENVVERIAALSSTGKSGIELLPEHIRKPTPKSLVSDTPSAIPTMDEIEKAFIHWVLTQQGGQKQKAAEILGIGRSTLDRKIEKYGL